MNLTDWFYGTTPPVRPGVYETRMRGKDGTILRGYAQFNCGVWRCNQKTPEMAARVSYPSVQQNKEWRGLAEEPK